MRKSQGPLWKAERPLIRNFKTRRPGIPWPPDLMGDTLSRPPCMCRSGGNSGIHPHPETAKKAAPSAQTGRAVHRLVTWLSSSYQSLFFRTSEKFLVKFYVAL